MRSCLREGVYPPSHVTQFWHKTAHTRFSSYSGCRHAHEHLIKDDKKKKKKNEMADTVQEALQNLGDGITRDFVWNISSQKQKCRSQSQSALGYRLDSFYHRLSRTFAGSQDSWKELGNCWKKEAITHKRWGLVCSGVCPWSVQTRE
mmetsp:Transcript_14375/g.22304  ORF Transcript_14375/g.22304 Transcript_14375/m.22304 type:complete len:147 (+) Transcript_14375:1786-2226(+)